MAGESRTAMIEAAATLFRRQGYDATSWRQVTRASDAPAGSIGFLFPAGKEQLAAETVSHVGDVTTGLMRTLAEDADPVDGARAWIRVSAAVLAESDFTDGCPVATLALELSHRSERIRSEIAQVYDAWGEVIAEAFGDRYEPEKASEIAEVILSAFEGALLLARARRSTAPLDTLAAHLDDIVDAVGGPRRRA